MGLTPVLPCHSFSGHTIYFSMVKWFSLYREPKNRIWLNDSSMAVVKHRNLRTVPQLQLFQNTAQIIPDCPLAEKQFGCNFPVIESQANPLQMTEVPGSYAGFYLESQIEAIFGRSICTESPDFPKKSLFLWPTRHALLLLRCWGSRIKVKLLWVFFPVYPIWYPLHAELCHRQCAVCFHENSKSRSRIPGCQIRK